MRPLGAGPRCWCSKLRRCPGCFRSGLRCTIEARLPPPHLPQLVDVVSELGFGPFTVDLIEVEPFELGPADLARTKLRRRLYVAPGSLADERLGRAMAELLDDRAGLLVPRTDQPIRVGIVRWRPRA